MKIARSKLILGTIALAGIAIGGWWFSMHATPASGIVAEAEALPAARPPKPIRSLTDFPTDSAELLGRLRSGDPALSPEGVAEALAYVRHPRFAESSVDPDAEYLNNTIALLLVQPARVPQLVDALLELAGDHQQPRILRDYAVQHFYQVWIREEAVEHKREIEVRLRSYVKDTESPLQGTALLTTARLFGEPVEQRSPAGKKLIPLGAPVEDVSSDQTVAYSRDEFVADALQAAGNATSSSAARASAFHALVRLRVNETAALARSVISHGDTPDEALCAAIAALSEFGDPSSDSQALAAISSKSEMVHTAAQKALARLQVRPAHP